MRAIPLFILTVLPILVLSCGPADSSYFEARADREHVAWSSMPTHGEKETPDYEKQAYAQAPAFATGRGQKQKRTGGALTYFPVHHPEYTMPTRFVPLPRHWQVGQYWTTPSGTKAGVLTSGKLPPHVTSVDQVINQIFLPKLNGRVTVKKMESLPEIAQADQEEQEGYYSYMPTRHYTQAKGIEFVEHDTGNRGYCVVHLLIKTSQAGRYGSYWVSNLTNDGSTFEQDKKAFLYALANMQINPAFLAEYNRRQAGQLAANDASFQRKMAARWQSFNQAMAANRTNSDISDIYQETWKNTSNMNDRGHESGINAIHERNAMINPYTGQTTNIESGYKYYFVNRFGEYFGTNDEFYNPQRDPNRNHYEWRRMHYPGNN